MQKARNEQNFLAHSLREGRHAGVGMVAELKQTKQFKRFSFDMSWVQIIQLTDKLKIFHRCQCIVQSRVFGNVANSTFNVERLGLYVHTQHGGLTGEIGQHTNQDFDRRRLARAIGTDIAHDLPRRYAQVNAFQNGR